MSIIPFSVSKDNVQVSGLAGLTQLRSHRFSQLLIKKKKKRLRQMNLSRNYSSRGKDLVEFLMLHSQLSSEDPSKIQRQSD